MLWEALRLVGLETRLKRRPEASAASASPSSWGASGHSSVSDEERDLPDQRRCSGLDVELDLDVDDRPSNEPKVPDASPQLQRNGASLSRIHEERQSGYTSEDLPDRTCSSQPRDSPNSRRTPRKLQLSGSQRRLLVLARLLLHRRRARLVLLDEPFAGMEQNEVTPLHSMLKKQLGHAAMLVVTHRLLPVLHFFSRILVFEEGRCVQDAPPAAALADDGHLRQLFLQAPSRLQGHVERMLALRRSEGLHAVHTLLQSVNLSTGQSEPELIFQDEGESASASPRTPTEQENSGHRTLREWD
ncbi:unnamed protein product [Durusdinium trenchii]|uniref:ABC transporter domain-containing protein n=1 Tax=Durusdinium trenchii TaxID=1381693 RepID=A0ABP0PDW3_9DINO